jgi:hypothetical protein
LLIAPAAVGRALGVDSRRRVRRRIGLVDLGLAPGLHFRTSAMAVACGLRPSNPLITLVAVANARSVRARVIAAGLIGATVMDLRTAARMRSSGP